MWQVYNLKNPKLKRGRRHIYIFFLIQAKLPRIHKAFLRYEFFYASLKLKSTGRICRNKGSCKVFVHYALLNAAVNFFSYEILYHT